MSESQTPNTPTNEGINEGTVVVTPFEHKTNRSNTRAPSGAESIASTGTPPQIQEAIESIQEFEYEYRTDAEIEDETLATALMMFSPKAGGTELPTLRTETWTFNGERPNPISIGTARKFLAAAYAAVPCEDEEAGVHGYAWMIEEDKTWLKREGITTTLEPPSKPAKVRDYDVKAQWKYMDDLQSYTLYNHLVQEGKATLVEWFGKPMFMDLCIDGLLPTTLTPRRMLEHLEATYAQRRDRRRYLEQVEAAINSAYNPKQPVEAYFMTLQDAIANAELLGQPYTPEIIMNKALKQFENHNPKDSYKAEKKWNEKADKEQTWDAFKTFWKEEIHQWHTMSGNKKYANQVDIDTVMTNLAALQAETRSLQIENVDLTKQLQFQQALQTEHRSSSGSSRNDDISTITDQLSGLNRRFDKLDEQVSTMSTKTDSRSDSYTDGIAMGPRGDKSNVELLDDARKREPGDYRNMNGGKGRQFTFYCWKCGANTTHWTRRCYELTDEEKKKYRGANFRNPMGGNTRYIERKGKYQADFNFDSL